MTLQSDFSDEVEAFLKATALSPSRFGRDALGDPGFVAELRKGRLIVTAGDPAKPVQFVQRRAGRAVLQVSAQEIRVDAQPTPGEGRIDVQVEMLSCVVGVGDEQAPHENFSRPLVIRMPPDIREIENRTAGAYIASGFGCRAITALASSLSSKPITGNNGPKISSCISGVPGPGSSISVGSMYSCPLSVLPPDSTC